MKRMVIGCSVASALLLSAGVVSALNLPAQGGRPANQGEEGCWAVNWTGLQETCSGAPGTVFTKKRVIPVPNLASGYNNLLVRAKGGFLQTGPWASCIGVSTSRVGTSQFTNFSTLRGTTSASDSNAYQSLSLGNVFVNS